ncbi:hypothetical protein E0493_17225 [Roseomonas sp. M0104]|uniref:Uncharacterized protein n=1 Tax=Teichococcus coralli TaxID=2545983 RepID=A0A845BD96_9PROT|nr:hypothetical protein [Pseudoroseomonas coralli]MXP65091.1 hypothetical protein [Pseudoroseomonas coralli]
MQNDPSRSIRVRVYGEAVRDIGRRFRLAPGTDVKAALKRAALAAVPRHPDWTMRVFCLERTAPGERLAFVLDGLARREAGGGHFAAALAAAEDGSVAVLVAAAKELRRLELLGGALGTRAR